MSAKKMENNLCDPIKDDLKAYTDGELPLMRRATVRRHLARCPACRAELSEMERITQLMKTTANIAPASLTPNFRARLIAAVEGTPVDAPPSVPLWRRRPTLVFAGGGTLIAASLLTFMTLQRQAAFSDKTTAWSASQVGVATMMYAQDYDETFPRSKAEMQGVRARAAATGRKDDSVWSLAASVPETVRDNPRGSDRNGNSESRRQLPLLVQSAPGGRVTLEDADRGLTSEFAKRRTPLGLTAGVIAGEAERKVHREASLGVAVDKLEETSEKVEQMITSRGGYVASNNLETDASGYKSAELALKVPEKDFEQTLKDIAALGNVVSKSVTGEDITEKTSDATSDEQILTDEVQKLDARLKTESMSERRTGQKEGELREARMQLARTRARLGLLRNMASLATLNVSLTQKAKKAAVAPQPGWINDMRETNRAASLAFQSAVRVPIVLFIWILAFSPLWIPLIIAYRYAAVKTALTKAPPAKPAMGD